MSEFWTRYAWAYTSDDLLDLAEAERAGVLTREERQMLRGQTWPAITFGMETKEPTQK